MCQGKLVEVVPTRARSKDKGKQTGNTVAVEEPSVGRGNLVWYEEGCSKRRKVTGITTKDTGRSRTNYKPEQDDIFI